MEGFIYLNFVLHFMTIQSTQSIIIVRLICVLFKSPDLLHVHVAKYNDQCPEILIKEFFCGSIFTCTFITLYYNRKKIYNA